VSKINSSGQYTVAVNVILIFVFGLLVGVLLSPYPAAAACGDGVMDLTDVCDDDGTAGGDGCSISCTVEPGWICAGEPSVCTGQGNIETTTHKILLALAPWIVFFTFCAGCWGWPLKKKRNHIL